jgi:glucose/mannose-6-phosphate isomerase
MSAAGPLLDAAMGIPDHLRDALWRIESARLGEMDAPAAFVCGMGGSGIGGDLAAAAIGDRLNKPLLTARGYELPSWAPAGSAVLCSSYSGDTEETLACYSAAEALGAQRLVATTGGALAEAARRDGVPVIGLPGLLPAPRAAVAYMFSTAAELAALAGAAPRIHTEIDAAAAALESERDGLRERARELAGGLGDSGVIVYGSDLTAPAAYRWKTQMNENAKARAFAGQLPEADHNEIVGWSGSNGGFSAVFLEDSDQHPREGRRFELTAKLIEPHADRVVRIETEGESRTERVLWAVMLGDLFSLELAAARGIDPMPIEAIDRLKEELGSP